MRKTIKPEADNRADILIVGGGMVGLSLASLLARAHPQWRIVLVEQLAFPAAEGALIQPSFDARSTAISHGSVEILSALGIWQSLQAQATAITQVHVSDRGHFLGANILASEQKLDAVGYVIPNAVLGKVLLAHAKTYKNLLLIGESQVNATTPVADGQLLDIVSGNKSQTWHARLAVVADGSESPLRSALGIHHQVRDYEQTAIICNVAYTHQHKGVAFERFTDEGPLALLPLAGARGQESALIWTLPHALADELLAASDDAFLTKLQQRFGYRLGTFTRVSKRAHFPLRLVTAEEQVRSHLVLLGNAAHFLHPVAGQGFNLSLRDCAALVETLGDESRLGELSQLMAYEAKQKADQFTTIEFSHYLVKLFSTDAFGAVAARHLGLLSLELIPLLKREFVAQTMGTAGRYFGESSSHSTPSEKISTDTLVAEQAPQQLSVDDTFDTSFDITIVGAGLVGATLACALIEASERHQKPLRVCVVDAAGDLSHNAFDPSVPKFDARVVALNQTSEALLARIGIWPNLAACRVSPYTQMYVWDGEGSAAIHFDAQDARVTHLGHIIENGLIVKTLHSKMRQSASITFIRDSVQGISLGAGASLQLASGKTLKTSLLVAADGARSPLRAMANIPTREWDYGHTAIVTTVKTQLPHQKTAWQRFTHQGPLAFLPLQHLGEERYCSIVWSLEESVAEQKMALDDEHFAKDLATAIDNQLGNVAEVDRRFAIKLRQCHATDYVRPHFALIGDAAHAIHPLAGQGVNLGFADISALVEEVERAWSRGIPISDYSILRRYQRSRMGDNLTMMATMEGFKQLFGSQTPTALLVRNLGMAKVNQMKIVKNWIVRHALGNV